MTMAIQRNLMMFPTGADDACVPIDYHSIAMMAPIWAHDGLVYDNVAWMDRRTTGMRPKSAAIGNAVGQRLARRIHYARRWTGMGPSASMALGMGLPVGFGSCTRVIISTKTAVHERGLATFVDLDVGWSVHVCRGIDEWAAAERSVHLVLVEAGEYRGRMRRRRSIGAEDGRERALGLLVAVDRVTDRVVSLERLVHLVSIVSSRISAASTA